MKRPLLCGVALGFLSPLTCFLLTYALAAVSFLPVDDYLPLAALVDLLIAGVAGLIFAALFSRFASPHGGWAFLTWVVSALAFVRLPFWPSPDDIYYRLSGYEYHLGGGGGFAYMMAFGLFLVVFFLSFLLFFCLFSALSSSRKKNDPLSL